VLDEAVDEPCAMRPLRREVRARPRGSQLTWLTVTALLALGMTLGVYAAGARCQRAGHPVHHSTAR
jgi:hypothetical protein